jgi:hypothetical protein
MRYLLIILFLAGCGGGGQTGITPSTAATTSIVRGNQFPLTGMEASPVVFNGELLYVGTMLNPAKIVIVRQRDAVVLASLPYRQFVSAMVDGNSLYIFGTNAARNSISVMSSSDLVNWGEATIYTVPSGNVFNTSASKTPSGYVLTYEVCDKNYICFNARFLTSPDLITWTDTGNQYRIGYYTACPTIRYFNGYYYLFYLTDTGSNYDTRVSRSTDLVSWEQSPVTVLAGSNEVSGNASDFDFIEFNGQIRILYSNLSQNGQAIPNAGLREALFNGSMTEFVRLFF